MESKLEKLGNWRSAKLTRRCGAKARIVQVNHKKGLARRNRERHAMLADAEEEQEQDVMCFDDITSKELPWHAVRKSS